MYPSSFLTESEMPTLSSIQTVAIAALLLYTTPLASAQDEGPLLVRDGAHVEITERDRTRARRPTGENVSLSVGDRLEIVRGSAKICFAEVSGPTPERRGGECSRYGNGSYRITAYDPPSPGLLARILQKLRQLAGGDRGVQRSSRVAHASRTSEPPPTLPPTLLFSRISPRALDARLVLVWLPAQVRGTLVDTEVRVYRQPDSECARGDLAAETSATTGPIDLTPMVGPLTPGESVRVHLRAASGEDEGCVTLASTAEAVEARRQIEGVLAALDADEDDVFSRAAALEDLGYPYDALVLLDRERLGAGPLVARRNDVQQAWGALLEHVGAAK